MKKGSKTSGLVFQGLLEESRFLIYKVLKKFSLTPTELEDISQEALLRAIEASERTDVQYPKQFLISIAKNIAREEMRRRSRYYDSLTEENGAELHIQEEPSQERVLDAKQKLRFFVEAMGGLPPQCKRVFAMKHIQGASHKDIAATLGISVSTVEKHAAAGLKACRAQMLQNLNASQPEERVEYLFLENKRK